MQEGTADHIKCEKKQSKLLKKNISIGNHVLILLDWLYYYIQQLWILLLPRAIRGDMQAEYHNSHLLKSARFGDPQTMMMAFFNSSNAEFIIVLQTPTPSSPNIFIGDDTKLFQKISTLKIPCLCVDAIKTFDGQFGFIFHQKGIKFRQPCLCCFRVDKKQINRLGVIPILQSMHENIENQIKAIFGKLDAPK